MMSTILMSILAFIVSSIMLIMNMILSKKTLVDREKSSPFECGFDPSSSPRIPFSIKFFLIAMIFLIFDIEIALMLPMMPTLTMTDMDQWMITSIVFTLVLMIGLYHEWNQGALNWTQ